MKKIRIQTIAYDDLLKLIEFDNKYLLAAMKEMSIPAEQLPPLLTLDELKKAFFRKDTLEWIFINNARAGYFWLEKKQDCIYIAGFAIKNKFYGMGISKYILGLAEKKARENGLELCRLAVIPVNGRAVNAYLKCGYKITSCIPAFFGIDYPDSFRFIMEKNLSSKCSTSIPTDACEISCISYEKLKNATDEGYVGVRLILSKSKSNFENKIWFEKYL